MLLKGLEMNERSGKRQVWVESDNGFDVVHGALLLLSSFAVLF